MGDGGTIANLGQKFLNLSAEDRKSCSVFQIAAVARPLISVGKLFDEGHNIPTRFRQLSETNAQQSCASFTALQVACMWRK